jgi:hypothetical protein
MGGRTAQMALRDLCNVVDEIRFDAERRGEAGYGAELGVVERPVDEGHDRGEAIRRRDGRSRHRDRAHGLENGLRLCGSGIDMHDCAPVGSSDGAERITPPSTRTCTERYRVGLISPSVARSHPDNNGQHFARDHALARNRIPEL